MSQNDAGRIDEQVLSRIQSALARRVEHNLSARVCVSDDLQYGLVGNTLCRISALPDGEFSISEIAMLKFENSLPPVQWILSYSADELLLVGSQTLGIEEAVALCGEPDPSLGHEICLAPKQMDYDRLGSLAICSHCLQMRYSDTYWKCRSCNPSGQMAGDNFSLCMKCICNGRWCREKSHDLVREEDEEKNIGWKATHVVYKVNLRENECWPSTVYEARTPLASSTKQPIVNKNLGLLVWKLDDSRILTLTLGTGESEISADVAEEIPTAQPQVSPPNDKEFANTDDMRAAITPYPEEDFLVSELSATKSLSLPDEPAKSSIRPVNPLCGSCPTLIHNSKLLKSSSIWAQHSLEKVLNGSRSGFEASTVSSKNDSSGEDKEKQKLEPEKTVKSVMALEVETLQHHSIHSLATSILHGCLLCSRLWQEMEQDEKEAVRNQIRRLLHGGSDPSGNTPQLPADFHGSAELVVDVVQFSPINGNLVLRRDNLGVKKYDNISPSETRRCSFSRVSESLAKNKALLYETLAGQGHAPFATLLDTGTETSLSVARKWLHNCERFHHCRHPKLEDWIPTRLVDVGSIDGRQSPRVYITTQKDKGKDYMTLSHCWGNSNAFQLTRSNYNQLTREFSGFEIPATFLHAIQVCRSLGYHYLWIDSLCIIQDDGEDWEREAILMSSVYQNSACTIAALFSENVQSGCFSVRNLAGATPLVFEASPETVFVMPGRDQENVKISDDHKLNRRGWVFQERLLSPRTLGFSSTGLIWDCKEAQFSETSPNENRAKRMPSNESRDKELMKQIMNQQCRKPSQEGTRNHFLEAWYELAIDYSRLDLTYPSDKLIALAGVTQMIQQSCGFDYFYGLWNDPTNPELFLSQLLWHTREPGRSIDELYSADRPPSFSWTYCDCEVDYPITFHDRIINDSTMGITRRSGWLRTGTSYLQVLSRHKLMLVSGSKGESSPWDREVVFQSKVIAFMSSSSGSARPMLILEGPVNEAEIRLTPHGEGWEWEYPWDTLPEDEVHNFQRTRWFFPDQGVITPKVKLLTIARWYRSWDSRWYVAGLALEDTEYSAGVKTDVGETMVRVSVRVGYFEHSWTTQHKHWYDVGDKQPRIIM